MADSLCPVCLARFPSPKDRTAHLRADHDGTTMTWKGRIATIHNPDGSTRELSMRDFRELRKGVSPGAPATPPTDGDVAPLAGPDGAPGEPPAAPAGPPRIPRVGKPAPRPVTDPIAQGISRAAVEEAFTQAFLADLIRQASQVISEWDGAGERGTFSRTESATIASLLYDQTVDVIIRRFAGNVSRVKAFAAVLIIAGGKGRIHAHAYAARQARIKAGLPPLDPLAPASVAPAPAPATVILPFPIDGSPGEPPAAPGPVIPPWELSQPRPATQPVPAPQPSADGFQPLTVAEIARRQQAWAAEQSAASADDPTARMLREAGRHKSALEEVFGD